MTGEKPDCVTSPGSVMYVVASTLTGSPVGGISQSCTELGVTVLAWIRSAAEREPVGPAIGARMAPVVEKPSRVRKPAAAAFGCPCASVHAPVVALKVPCASPQAP